MFPVYSGKEWKLRWLNNGSIPHWFDLRVWKNCENAGRGQPYIPPNEVTLIKLKDTVPARWADVLIFKKCETDQSSRQTKEETQHQSYISACRHSPDYLRRVRRPAPGATIGLNRYISRRRRRRVVSGQRLIWARSVPISRPGWCIRWRQGSGR